MRKLGLPALDTQPDILPNIKYTQNKNIYNPRAPNCFHQLENSYLMARDFYFAFLFVNPDQGNSPVLTSERFACINTYLYNYNEGLPSDHCASVPAGCIVSAVLCVEWEKVAAGGEVGCRSIARKGRQISVETITQRVVVTVEIE